MTTYGIKLGEQNPLRNGNTMEEISYTLKTTGSSRYVLVTPKLTSTPSKSMNDTSITETMETSPKSTPTLFPTSTSSVADSLAKLSALLESGEDSTILEGLCSSIFAALRKPNGLGFSSLRTSKDYSITMGGKLSESSSPRWMNWGTTVNGKCVTARISVSPKTGKGSSLSDILEEHPDPKYFLSEKVTTKILEHLRTTKPAKATESTIQTESQQPSQAKREG